MPALPLDEAGKYVAGAYVVFVALLLIYVAIMAARLARIDRELAELAELAERRSGADPDGADAGAQEDVRGEAEDKVFERERSSRQVLR
jgi:flagellar biosynthesis/type III secretory pathway M-ring protein FliF/YscJ